MLNKIRSLLRSLLLCVTIVHRESNNSLPDKNLDAQAGPPVEVIHRVKTDVAGVGSSQVVFDHSVSVFIPTEYLREYESDYYLGFTS